MLPTFAAQPRRTSLLLLRQQQSVVVAAASERQWSSTARSLTAPTTPISNYNNGDGGIYPISCWRRNYHYSSRLYEEEMSEKEKKKALKAKAKAAAAAAEQEEGGDDEAAAKKMALQEKLAAKKAAAASTEEAAPASAESETTTTTTEAPSSDNATAASSPEYSTPELTEDAAKHKAGLNDPEVPFYQNPLHHNNPETSKVFREDFESQEEFEAANVPAPALDLGDGRVAAPEYLHALADEIVHLNMLEMNELVNKIADHYGFNEAMLSPDDQGGDEADDDEAEEAPKEEAKTAFDIKLVEFDAKAKIKVIKEVRALAGLGLKEAKELVEGAPKVIHKGVKKEEAEEIKAKLEELGATIEIV